VARRVIFILPVLLQAGMGWHFGEPLGPPLLAGSRYSREMALQRYTFLPDSLLVFFFSYLLTFFTS